MRRYKLCAKFTGTEPERRGHPEYAFLAPGYRELILQQILHGLSDTASQYDYNVFMYGTNDDLEGRTPDVEGIRKEMVKGVVLIPVTDNDEKTIELLKELEKNQDPSCTARP